MESKKHPWEEEQSICLATTKNIIETQFPQLVPVQIDLIGNGWDNNVYLVNDNCTFRFPRRKVAVELLDLEKNLLPSIASFLPLKIPIPKFYGKPCKDFPWPFLGYLFLPGKTACRARLDRKERIAMAAPLAKFLKSLHNIPIEKLPISVPKDLLKRLDLDTRQPRLIKRLSQLEQKNILKDAKPFTKIVENARPVKSKSVLLHGDFYARHLLLNNAKFAGVIDWGDIHQGNPATDLEIVYCFLPREGKKIFFEIYGNLSKSMQNLALFRAIHRAELLVYYGANIKDSDLLKEGLISFEYILQERI